MTSPDWVRRRYFEVFYRTHIAGFLGLLLFSAMHYRGEPIAMQLNAHTAGAMLGIVISAAPKLPDMFAPYAESQPEFDATHAAQVPFISCTKVSRSCVVHTLLQCCMAIVVRTVHVVDLMHCALASLVSYQSSLASTSAAACLTYNTCGAASSCCKALHVMLKNKCLEQHLAAIRPMT